MPLHYLLIGGGVFSTLHCFFCFLFFVFVNCGIGKGGATKEAGHFLDWQNCVGEFICGSVRTI